MTRPNGEKLRDMFKRHPYPDYIIIPAAGSLIGDVPAFEGKTAADLNLIAERMISEHGA